MTVHPAYKETLVQQYGKSVEPAGDLTEDSLLIRVNSMRSYSLSSDIGQVRTQPSMVAIVASTKIILWSVHGIRKNVSHRLYYGQEH